jgi:hypothetical protein
MYKPGKCVRVPEGVNGDQLARIFLKYTDEHPENLHLSASVSVWNASLYTFPCH